MTAKRRISDLECLPASTWKNALYELIFLEIVCSSWNDHFVGVKTAFDYSFPWMSFGIQQLQFVTICD